MSKNEVQRNYSFSDSTMLQESGTMNSIFNEDKTAFSSFDSSFADPFSSNWEKDINSAKDMPVDSIYEAELTEKTKLVQSKLEESRIQFQKVKYFIEKAFPDKKEIWNQFGVGDYMASRNSEAKMVKLLGIMHNAAQQFKEQLISAGINEADITQIQNLKNDLSDADLEQEKTKKKRPAVTQERIKQLNNCYSYMQKVSKAAKIIFTGNSAKYNQYLLPNERTSKKEEVTEQKTETTTIIQPN
jgi:hypothetical protein